MIEVTGANGCVSSCSGPPGSKCNTTAHTPSSGYIPFSRPLSDDY